VTDDRVDEIDTTRRRSAAVPTSRRTQVLALSGGGYRGLYTAHFLAAVEESFRLRIARRFDLVIGTSIGSLIAAALAVDVPARAIAAKIIEHGPRIFPNAGSKATLAKQYAWEAPYRQGPVRAAVLDTIGEDAARTPLSEIKASLAICAVNFTYGRPEVFRSRGLAKRRASKVPLIDAVLASAAAPTYFPVHEIGAETLIDGGLIANAPEMQGLAEALSMLHRPLAEIYVLAVGTAARKEGAALVSFGAPSGSKWLVGHGLFEHTLAAQEALAREQCTAVLGARYCLVDREPLQTQVAAIRRMDYTSPEATKTLVSLAEDSWREMRSRPAFRRFFT
jgi:cGAMP-activated phospholipase